MNKIKVIFVCLGNICRSPAAEAIFNKIISLKEQQEMFVVDSAGTSSYHQGESADKRMIEHAKKRGYNITSISRQFKQSDFDFFDYIVVMDDSNYMKIKSKALTTKDEDKVIKMASFLLRKDFDHIPDPYYEGADGFNTTIDLLEESCDFLFKKLNNQY